jgi:hypothetical protein
MRKKKNQALQNNCSCLTNYKKLISEIEFVIPSKKGSSENAWDCFIWSSYTAEGVVFGIEMRETWLAG